MISVKQPLKDVYEGISEFVIADLKSPEGICLTCLIDAKDRHNLAVDVNYLGEKIAIISVKKGEGEEVLEWVFANEYQ